MGWLLDIDPRETEIISCLSLFVWGVVVYFGNFGMSPAYVTMEQVATNVVWAVLAISLSLAQFHTLFLGRRGLRCIVSLLSCWMFATMSGLTLQAAWAAPIPYIYGVLSLANAWATAQLTK